MKDTDKANFSSAFENINPNHYAELHDILNKASIPLKDLKIESRIYNYWKTEKLPLNSAADGKWAILNFIEYAWLRTVKELRAFGLTMDKIKKVKQVLIKEVDLSILNKQGNEKVFEKAIQSIQDLEIDAEAKKIAIDHIKKGKLSELLKAEGISFNVLGALLFRTLMLNEDVGIIIYNDGKCQLWIDELYQDKKAKGAFYPPDLFYPPHIYISFTYLIGEFISDKKLEKYIAPFSLPTPKEFEVLKKIRENDVREITIKFPKGSATGDMDIITKKNIALPKDKQVEICRLLQLGNYQSISLTTQSDGGIFIEKSHRKKIK